MKIIVEAVDNAADATISMKFMSGQVRPGPIPLQSEMGGGLEVNTHAMVEFICLYGSIDSSGSSERRNEKRRIMLGHHEEYQLLITWNVGCT
jgi:hypothetical protein